LKRDKVAEIARLSGCKNFVREKFISFLWADFKQHIINREINEWQNDCRFVSAPNYSIQMRVVTVDTAKHFIIPIEALHVCLKCLTFLFIRQHKLWNDAYCYGNLLQVVRCCKYNCFLTPRFNKEYCTRVVSEILFKLKNF